MIISNWYSSILIYVLFIMFSWIPAISANHLTPKPQYSFTRKLFNQINSLKWHHNNLPKYDEVITKCKVIIQQNPNTEIAIRAQELIIQCYEKQAEYSKKDQAFDKYIEMIEQNQGIGKAVEKIIEAGNSHFNRAEYFEARLHYERLLKKYPTHKEANYAHYRIAECYKRTKAYEKAIAKYKKIIQLFPKEKSAEEACLKLARVFTSGGRYTEAIDTLHMLLNISPQSDLIPTIKFYLACCYYKNGNRSEAKRVLENFLKDYPSSSMAYSAKAFLHSLSELNVSP